MADSEFWHRTADERAAEITRLRSENEALREDISRYVSRDTERLAEVEKLREALKPFATSHVAENVDEHGWTSNIHREQISVWFGPSDFFRARAALAEGNSNG